MRVAPILMLTALAVGFASRATALDCRRSRTHVERAICGNPTLLQRDHEMDMAFAEALKKAPARERELRTEQQAWLADRDAGCVTPDRKALARCLEIQYRYRLQALASSNATPAASQPNVPSTALIPTSPGASASSTTDDPVNRESYVSDTVSLQLKDGLFRMRELNGSRAAEGHYAYADGVLTLLDGTGDTGKTSFPLYCKVIKTVDGFAVSLGQPRCHPLDGIAFKAVDQPKG